MPLSRDATWDRIAGCIHGLLVGDALGCPVEGWTAAEIRAHFGGELREMVDVPGPGWRPRGLHSDDGQQALAVIDSICCDPQQPERVFAQLMVALRDAMPQRSGRWGLHRGVSRNFRQTVRGLQASDARDPFGHAVPSAGNGAAMRIAPVGLWWRDDPPTRDRRAAAISAVTHHDLRGIAGAQAIAIVVSNAFEAQPGPILDEALIESLQRATASASELLGVANDRRFVDLLASLVDHRRQTSDLDQLLDGIRDRAMRRGGAAQKVEATSGFAPCSVLTALLVADLAKDFEHGLVTAVNLGGDTDTIGAMVGAILGARVGVGEIPMSWLDSLEATGVLIDRVDLIQDRESREPWPDLLNVELEWDRLYEKRPAILVAPRESDSDASHS
ncbi:ADP-ribosylglycohydrolase family protein [Pseudenhygromyxa sp. WMMC2535]|uniref:ADP-ribosylglycohydrolase family protein n=1 Tax=Pseudenhygromyxa sp. WMMC2535 TaxID=2712867 RepID=UPI0015549DCD|nr:ADP-ribosylglycohydrolase family protein [Pseudenhygromyxa sp. WMMC2535]